MIIEEGTNLMVLTLALNMNNYLLEARHKSSLSDFYVIIMCHVYCFMKMKMQ